MKIGIIGVGGMGSGIAKNLLKTGNEIFAYDKQYKCEKTLNDLGINTTTSLKELQKDASVIFLSLPDTDSVDNTIFGHGGLVSLNFKGTIIDTGTTDPSFTTKAAEQLINHHIKFIDAPVSGLESKALTGELTSMLGSSNEELIELRSLIESYSKTLVVLGGIGQGQLAKMLNNVLYNTACASVAEILAVAVKHDINLDGFYEIVCNSTGNSKAFEIFVPLIRQGIFSPGGEVGAGLSMEKAFKDMLAFKEVTQNEPESVPVTNACFQTYQAALDKGFGDKNKGAMARVWHDWPEA